MNRSTPIPYSNIYSEQQALYLQKIKDRDYVFRVLLFILVHIPLVLLFRINPVFPTIHAVLTLAVGFLWLRYPQPQRVITVLAYITGSEILWRGTGALVFWEYGKYAVIFLLILALLKYRTYPTIAKWPIIYFTLLLPSILVMPGFDREAIASNLAGPFTLALSCMFFSTVRLSISELKPVLIALISPVVGLGFLASFMTFTAEELTFTGESSFLTSAGTGPNQVSTALGLGVLFTSLYAFTENRLKFLRAVMIFIGIWLLGQTAFTFSRGGLWGAMAGIIVAGFYLVRERRSRVIFTLSSVTIFLVSYYVVLPALDQISGGTLEARLNDLDTTGRAEIARADWETFLDHPWVGVGPGQSPIYHVAFFRYSNAHTEYTRMLAEHGTLGLISLLILLGVIWGRFVKREPNTTKAIVVSLTVWAAFTMVHAATRLAAPAFIFGLASAYFVEQAGDVTQAS